jgi:actin-related protein
VESVELRNGSSIAVGQERFGAAEILFNPSLCDLETKGLSDMIFDTIQKADIDCRVDLYQNIILSGGMSLLPGIQERLQEDLDQLYCTKVLNGDRSRTPGWRLRVHSPKSREILVFEGAALFADFIQSNRAFWVSQKDFESGGIEALFEKCQIH